MANLYIKNNNQRDAYSSPWSRKEAILIRLWKLTWILFVSWLPKVFSCWYIFLLRLFGCKVEGRPFIAPSCKIYAPWLLKIGHKSCLAPKSEVYNLGPVTIGERATIAQHSYICNGTHDLSDKRLPLLVGDMCIDDDVFIGAKAIVLPGVLLKEGCVIGAGSVVTRDVEPWTIVAGNPARYIKRREMKNE